MVSAKLKQDGEGEDRDIYTLGPRFHLEVKILKTNHPFDHADICP